MLREIGADGVALFGSVAFGEIREAEPAPVLIVHHFGEERLVARDVGFKILDGILIEVHVRPGVIAKRIAGFAPGFEHGRAAGFALVGSAVDEAVDGKKMRGAEGGENFVGDVEARFAGRERAVSGEVVESEGEAERLGTRDGGESEKERSCRGGDNEKRCAWRSKAKHGSSQARVVARRAKGK